jgi:hypothetical protein
MNVFDLFWLAYFILGGALPGRLAAINLDIHPAIGMMIGGVVGWCLLRWVSWVVHREDLVQK